MFCGGPPRARKNRERSGKSRDETKALIPEMAEITLYSSPWSTSGRCVNLVATYLGIPHKFTEVSFDATENKGIYSAWYKQINPSTKEGDFCLTESGAIAKFLCRRATSTRYSNAVARKGASLYPSEPHANARQDELIDWFNTQLYGAAANCVYTQLFDHHKLKTEEASKAKIEAGIAAAHKWLGDHPFVAGNHLTLADLFGYSRVHLFSVIGDFQKYPNVERWFNTISALPETKQCYGLFDANKADKSKLINL